MLLLEDTCSGRFLASHEAMFELMLLGNEKWHGDWVRGGTPLWGV